MKTFLIISAFGFALLSGAGCHAYVVTPRHSPPPHYHHHHHGHYGHPVVDVAVDYNKLGEQVVTANSEDVSSASFSISPAKLSSLLIVVNDSNLELADVVLTYEDGQTFSTGTAHFFNEGVRSCTVEVPAGERNITAVDLKYKKLPENASARIELWGN